MRRKVRCTICDSVTVPIITPTLHCLKWPRLASLLWSHCQSECKINEKIKITHEVKLLTCDLMWKICISLFCLCE
jgi:hypothetical protein